MESQAKTSLLRTTNYSKKDFDFTPAGNQALLVAPDNIVVSCARQQVLKNSTRF
jgi:hypothetical protein